VGVVLGKENFLQFGDFFSIFTQWLELATLNLVGSWSLPRPIKKSHSEEKLGLALGYGSIQNLGVPI